MNQPDLFILGPKRRGRPRADAPKVRLSAYVPAEDRATLAKMATSRGTSLCQLTGEILARVAQRRRDE